MPAAQSRWGNLLLNQDKTALVDVRAIRIFRLEGPEFPTATEAEQFPQPWEINGYYNKRDSETLATYQNHETAQVVFHDLCEVLRNGEVADFTLPPDTDA